MKLLIKKIKAFVYPKIISLRMWQLEKELKNKNFKPLHLPPRICRRGVIYVTMICNLRCKFCYYYTLRKKEHCKLKELKRQLYLYKHYFGLDSVDITGGEPTIYPYIREIVNSCKEIGLKSCIITNGQTPDTISELIDLGLNDLLISVHDLKKDYDSLVQAQGAFRRLLKTIKICHKKNFSFRTNTTVTKFNLSRLIKIAHFLKNEVKPRIHNWILFNPHEGTLWSVENTISFQPKYSEAATQIKKAIDILKPIWSNVKYIPLCFMKGYEHHVCNFMQWQYDPYEWEYRSMNMLSNKKVLKIIKNYKGFGISIEKFFNAWSKRITRHNIITDKCKKCSNVEICRQQYPQYVRRFGDAEFKPYLGKLILDSMCYREKYRKEFSK